MPAEITETRIDLVALKKNLEALEKVDVWIVFKNGTRWKVPSKYEIHKNIVHFSIDVTGIDLYQVCGALFQERE